MTWKELVEESRTVSQTATEDCHFWPSAVKKKQIAQLIINAEDKMAHMEAVMESALMDGEEVDPKSPNRSVIPSFEGPITQEHREAWGGIVQRVLRSKRVTHTFDGYPIFRVWINKREWNSLLAVDAMLNRIPARVDGGK